MRLNFYEDIITSINTLGNIVRLMTVKPVTKVVPMQIDMEKMKEIDFTCLNFQSINQSRGGNAYIYALSPYRTNTIPTMHAIKDGDIHVN